MQWLSKVKFRDRPNLRPSLRGVEYCLLGHDDIAFCIIPWDKRGGYHFDYYTGKVDDQLEEIEEAAAESCGNRQAIAQQPNGRNLQSYCGSGL